MQSASDSLLALLLKFAAIERRIADNKARGKPTATWVRLAQNIAWLMGR